jgi:hypothetical protein
MVRVMRIGNVKVVHCPDTNETPRSTQTVHLFVQNGFQVGTISGIYTHTDRIGLVTTVQTHGIYNRVYSILLVLDPTRAREGPCTEDDTHTEWVHEDIENAEQHLQDPDLRGFIFSDTTLRLEDEIPLRPGYGAVWIHEKVLVLYFSIKFQYFNYLKQVRMSMRWMKSRRLRVSYMAWGRFRNYVLQSSSDDLIAAELLLFDLIWGGADLMLDLT